MVEYQGEVSEVFIPSEHVRGTQKAFRMRSEFAYDNFVCVYIYMYITFTVSNSNIDSNNLNQLTYQLT